MLRKYACFTVLVSVISFSCMSSEPFNSLKNDVYNNICMILQSKIVHVIFLERFLSCATAEHVENSIEEDGDMLFTREQLSQYTGSDGQNKLYLSILGEVFDVTKGEKYYGPGQGYHGFTGKDGSRAFVTGEFTEEGLIDDVLDLKLNDLQSLSEWAKFYHTTYPFKGKLIGRYYNEKGQPTGYYYKLQQKLAEAVRQNEASEEFKLQYPPCNVEWDANTGSRVWCSDKSGGISRDWVGVPRKLYEPGSKTHRCACINLMGQSTEEDRDKRVGNIEEYVGCHPQATSCHVIM